MNFFLYLCVCGKCLFIKRRKYACIYNSGSFRLKLYPMEFKKCQALFLQSYVLLICMRKQYCRILPKLKLGLSAHYRTVYVKVKYAKKTLLKKRKEMGQIDEFLFTGKWNLVWDQFQWTNRTMVSKRITRLQLWIIANEIKVSISLFGIF